MCIFGERDCEYYDGHRRGDQSGPLICGNIRVWITDDNDTTGVLKTSTSLPDTVMNGYMSNTTQSACSAEQRLSCALAKSQWNHGASRCSHFFAWIGTYCLLEIHDVHALIERGQATAVAEMHRSSIGGASSQSTFMRSSPFSPASISSYSNAYWIIVDWLVTSNIIFSVQG